MIIEFKVGNYRSIRDEQTLSFVGSNYSTELPGNFVEPELPGMAGTRVLRCLALYGANASGKSNVLDALRFFAQFVANSFTALKPDSPTGTKGFGLEAEQLNKPTTFEIKLLVDDVRYTYGLSLTAVQVVEEYLVAYPTGPAQMWFERIWDAEHKHYKISGQTEHFEINEALSKSANDRVNASFLSIANQFALPKLTSIHQWFDKKLRIIELGSHRLSPNLTARYCAGAESMNKGVFAIVKNADLGITQLAVKRKSEEEVRKKYPESFAKFLPTSVLEEYEINMSHHGPKGSVPLDFQDESDGTQRIFELAGPWINALAFGHVICLDEIERSLHPYLVRDLIKLIMDPAYNRTGAQLLFSTHNPLLLDRTIMRRDQFWFTEKDDNGRTHLYPLTDFKPRPDEALMKGYMYGRYGAVPFIPKGLITSDDAA